MPSKYQMWITHNGEADKIQFPVLPPTYKVNQGGVETSVDIQGLGEILMLKERNAITVSFDSYFPAKPFQGMQVSSLIDPDLLVAKINQWRTSEKPVHFIITGTLINMFCTVSKFDYSEDGGDIGTKNYSIIFKEYRETKARQVQVNVQARKAYVPPSSPARTDNRVQEKTYTVVKGDCLWNISARFLGSGSRYTEIFNLNSGIIKNPNLIYPGQVLKLP